MAEKYLITAALPYVNNVPHIGNLVGSHLPADIYARYCRLKGRKTLFIGGTDEHGSPTEVAAQKAGIGVQELCDTFFDIHKSIYEWFDFSYDNFSRTSRAVNHELTQDLFLELRKNGLISEGEMRMPYCLKDERFLPDRFVQGKCPHCGYEKARGDQCEKCSSLLAPAELLEAKCTICGSKPEMRNTKHLFLNVDSMQGKLKAWIEKQPQWKAQTRNIALGWIREGLKKRAITRDLKWGVKVPLKGYEDKVFYVWFDAPIGYIASTKEWVENNKDIPENKKEKEFASWWKDESTKLFFFIGKDNVPFHTIFFPAMLMGSNKYILPQQVTGLQFMNYEGGKISKSAGHGVFCESLMETCVVPADVWRFYLTMKLPEVRDTDFEWKEFESRINTELIGNLSNFVNRATTFIKQKSGGKVERPEKYGKEEKEFLDDLKNTIPKVDALYDNIDFVSALQTILEFSSRCNKYFQQNEPWKREERREAVLYFSFVAANALAVMLSTVTPQASKKIRRILNLPENFAWEDAQGALELKSHEIGEPEILFEKLTKEKVDDLKAKSTKVGKIEEKFGKHKAQAD